MCLSHLSHGATHHIPSLAPISVLHHLPFLYFHYFTSLHFISYTCLPISIPPSPPILVLCHLQATITFYLEPHHLSSRVFTSSHSAPLLPPTSVLSVFVPLSPLTFYSLSVPRSSSMPESSSLPLCAPHGPPWLHSSLPAHPCCLVFAPCTISDHSTPLSCFSSSLFSDFILSPFFMPLLSLPPAARGGPANPPLHAPLSFPRRVSLSSPLPQLWSSPGRLSRLALSPPSHPRPCSWSQPPFSPHELSPSLSPSLLLTVPFGSFVAQCCSPGAQIKT